MAMLEAYEHDSFVVEHCRTGQKFVRDTVCKNEHATNASRAQLDDPAILAFHKSLPYYLQTPLISLPDLARELGIGHAFVKDESLRFGLPSFKILGASWAVFRAVCDHAGLDTNATLAEAGKAARKYDLKLVTCSAGNWGRAVGRMGKYLEIEVVVFMSHNINEATREKIRSEGARVEVVQGNYDDSIAAAICDADLTGSLLVMDTSWDGYEKIPQWVVDGYSTALTETDEQVMAATGTSPTVCIASVGVGSWAQAVVSHYCHQSQRPTLVSVEPQAASCLMESLHTGAMTSVSSSRTIMDGMNCGTLSTLAWPILQVGIDFSVAVSDSSSHSCVEHLQKVKVNAGPCGAATLAAARMLHGRGFLPSGRDTVLVMFNTEGSRDYLTPSRQSDV